MGDVTKEGESILLRSPSHASFSTGSTTWNHPVYKHSLEKLKGESSDVKYP